MGYTVKYKERKENISIGQFSYIFKHNTQGWLFLGRSQLSTSQVHLGINRYETKK